MHLITLGFDDGFIKSNLKIAEIFGKVYYHGCEDLTRKARIISRLPHLRRFHISPWSDIGRIQEELGRNFVGLTAVVLPD